MNTEFSGQSMANANAVLSVSALNQRVAQLLEKNLPLCWVSGEISNFTRAASGHWYFTLKDAGAQVRAVMFRGRAQYADFQPREGDRVEVRAIASLYAPRGDYQLNVEAIRRSGTGQLYELFLQLKQRLAAEGLFDAERKRPLPAFPRAIGIVSSPQAAALRDVLSTLKRRAAHIPVILYPTAVQGEGAAYQIAQAIASANARAECDLLIVCRGGGSIEDLWSFNEEIVARTIAHSQIPVISGVGHETDFSIADFAADIRAATPTAAAELAAQTGAAWHSELQQLRRRLERSWQSTLQGRQQQLDWLSRRLPSPTQQLDSKRQLLEHRSRRLQTSLQQSLQTGSHRLQQWQQRWQSARPLATPARLTLTHLDQRLGQASQQQLLQQRQQLQHLQQQLELLNPARTLERGYAIIRNERGQPARSVAELKPDTVVHISLAEGDARLGIASIQADLPV